MLLIVFALTMLWWSSNREPKHITLKYGELIQILKASQHGHGVSLQKVQVNRADIRGEIVTSDLASGGDHDKHSQTIPFRTPRIGLEEDTGLHDLLKEAVGAGFQGGEEDSALKTVGGSLLSLLFLVSFGVGLVLMLRWMMGGRIADDLRPQQGQGVRPEVPRRDVPGRGRHRRGGGRVARSGGFPQNAGEISGAGRPHPQGRVAGWTAGDGQDAAGPRGGRRGRGAVLQPQRQRFRRDVRRRRRGAGARSVRPGGQAGRRASSSSTNWTLWARRAPAWRSAATTSASRR